jgi:hypothetical protein
VSVYEEVLIKSLRVFCLLRTLKMEDCILVDLSKLHISSPENVDSVVINKVQDGEDTKEEKEEKEEKDVLAAKNTTDEKKRAEDLTIMKVEDYYLFPCPWCLGGIQVLQSQLACKIFRHATYNRDIPAKRIVKGDPINPHAPEDVCKTLVEENIINGCANPYTFDGIKVEKCGYI